MIYLDNAATSYPKPGYVIRELVRCCKYYCGNPGRSGHSMSLKAAEVIYKAREAVCELLGINTPERVIFTQNATHALNIAIKGLIRERCHVLISDLEHNSVIRPLNALSEVYGVEYTVFNHLHPRLNELRRPDTKYVITTLRSNVIGVDVNYGEISRFCNENRMHLILDASQYIGHNRLVLGDLYFDALCAPGHKGLYGIQGSGILVLSRNAEPCCLYEGGSGSNTFDANMPGESPEKFEAGTLSTPAIASLQAGIEYLSKIGIDYVEERLAYLSKILEDRLSEIESIKIYGCNNGICAFNLGALPSSDVSDCLNERHICVRSGYHCAPLTHKLLKTEGQGAVRASLSHLNKKSEIDELYKALKDCQGRKNF